MSAVTDRFYRGPASIANRWTRWWVGDGSWWSYGMCRICLGIAYLQVFQMMDRDYRVVFAAQVADQYRPIGLLYLLGRAVPDPDLFNVFRDVLRVSIPLLVVGLFSRPALWVSTALLCLLTGVDWAFQQGAWCHGYNPVLLAGLAMCVGPPSPLSVDGLVRRLRGRPVPEAARRRARGPVLLGQFALALAFFSGAMHKLVLTHNLPFAWCYSDGMRNILVMQYWVLNQDPPAWVRFVVGHEWAYKGMAVGNVVTQLTPLLACVFFRRPVVRLIGGAAFLLEGIGIGAVMGLWNPYWFPLAAFFIDWDWLLGRRPPGRAPAPPPAAELTGADRRQAAFALAFSAFYVWVALTHQGQKRFTYPFTAYPMYSPVFADPPYWDHRPYPLLGSTWDIQADPPVAGPAWTSLWSTHYATVWSQDPAVVAAQVQATLSAYGYRVRQLTIHKAVFEIPAYPATPDVRPVVDALAYTSAGGRPRAVHSVVAASDQPGCTHAVRLTTTGFTRPHFRFGVYAPLDAPVAPLAGAWADGRFHFRKPDGRVFVVVWVREDSPGAEERLFGCHVLK